MAAWKIDNSMSTPYKCVHIGANGGSVLPNTPPLAGTETAKYTETTAKRK